MAVIDLKRLCVPEGGEFEKAFALYEASFPEYEQRLLEHQKEAMEDEEYHFCLIEADGIPAGILLYWEAEHFIYVEHFAVLPDMRGKRYGEETLSLLKGKGKPVILEIDLPSDSMSIRRKGFYERCGFHENPYQHIHLPYRKNLEGHRLLIMSWPSAVGLEMYEEFYSYLKGHVMYYCQK